MPPATDHPVAQKLQREVLPYLLSAKLLRRQWFYRLHAAFGYVTDGLAALAAVGLLPAAWSIFGQVASEAPLEAGASTPFAAFRAGQGDFIHLQGPAPQQLERDKVGHIVTALADAIGPCAFSSIAATRDWLETDMARKFMRAYRKARAWLLATPAAEVAKAEAPYFKDTDPDVLTTTIATYQKLGNWSPHVEITRPAFEVALDVFQHSKLITKRHRYEDVVAAPPAV